MGIHHHFEKNDRVIGLYIHSNRLRRHWVIIRCLTNYSNILNYVFSYIIHCIIIIDLLKLLIGRFIATVMPRLRGEARG